MYNNNNTVTVICTCIVLIVISSLCRNNCVGGLTYCQRLDQVLDVDSGGVSKHLGQIADSMHEWEGSIAEGLGLTPAEVESIKYNKNKLEFQK